MQNKMIASLYNYAGIKHIYEAILSYNMQLIKPMFFYTTLRDIVKFKRHIKSARSQTFASRKAQVILKTNIKAKSNWPKYE